MITAQLKNHFKVKRLVSWSISPLHKIVLEAIGVDEIISPEKESADSLRRSWYYVVL
jgi:trk system potassium uptake protein TrkA